MSDVLASYHPGAAYDEMIDSEGEVRPAYTAVHSTLGRAQPSELRTIAESLANNYFQAGVTFDVGGVERPFPLDLVPRVIAAEEWHVIETGVAQRVRALEAFLADVYAEARVITDGVIPRQLVSSSTHYHRAVWGIEPANGVRVHVAGVDLIRTPAGDVRVLEDNVRVPSGVSYVMTNRSAMITAMPDAFSHQAIRPVAGYPQRLLAALRAAAPSGVDDPTVVVLTPGVFNSAYFEHTLLARTMGVELVEGRDLECRRGKVFMRTTGGLQRVDVIYRRIDDDFIDPVALPRRLDARRARTGERGPYGRGGTGQRHRQRSGRRQVDLHLRAGSDPLLPARGTDHRQRRHLAAGGGRGARGGAGPARRAGRQAGRRIRRQGDRDRPPRHGRGTRRAPPPRHHRPPRLDRPAGGPAVDRADPDRRHRKDEPASPTIDWNPGTWTCGRSRSTAATTSGCCPAA